MTEAVPSKDTYYLNMGPQHPSMHGVLRLFLHLDGEVLLEVEPIIGYSHRGHEKMAETRDWVQFAPNPSRVDYLSGYLYNTAYCEAVEKMADIEVPERAKVLRVILSELNRVSSHLLWFGTYLLDLGGVTPFLYTFDDREAIVDVMDAVTGSRLTYCHARFGGVSNDAPDDFADRCRAVIARIRSRFPDYEQLVTENVIFINRTRDIGIIDEETALAYGVTGPNLRAAGVAYDVRRAEPYSLYPELEFEIPTGTRGDILDRYRVRLAEMEQSFRIVEQCLDRLEEGPVQPRRLIRRIKPPEGDFYYATESARGHLGFYIQSDGSEIPYRIKIRTPSFANLSSMKAVMPGSMVADVIAILGSIDIVLPEIDR